MSTSTPRAPRGGARGATRNRSWTLAVVLPGFFILPMSMSGAGIAVPHIATELDASGPAAQWVVTAYFLAASSFMLVSGSLGDTIGRRRIYRFGAVTFMLGCLLAALAPNIGILLFGRVIAGIGAAGVMSSGGAILGATFTESARARAFAAVGVLSGLGLAFGPTLSGWLVYGAGWRFGFGSFTLPGLLLVAGTWLIPESRAAERPRIDTAGSATFAVALLALLLAVTQSAAFGLLSLVLVVASVALFVAFVIIEHRVPRPLLDLSLLSRPRFMGWLLAAATMSIGFGGILAFLPSYLQAPVGITATKAGLIMLLPTLPMMILPSIGARLVNNGTPPRLLITSALFTIAAGNLWLTVLSPDSTFLSLTGPLVVLGAGVGLAAGITDAQAMHQVPETQVGMAAGMLNTVRSTATALVLGLFGPALITLLTVKIGSPTLAGQAATGNIPNDPNAAAIAIALTESWRILLLTTAGICAAAAIASAVLLHGTAHKRRTRVPRLYGYRPTK